MNDSQALEDQVVETGVFDLYSTRGEIFVLNIGILRVTGEVPARLK